MPHTFDAVIIGCGAVGASCASQLSKRGLKTLVLDQAEAPAMGSTGKSAAGVRVQFANETNVRMSQFSLEVLRTFNERYGEDIGYRPIGYLLLVAEHQWQAHLETVAMQRRIGVPVEVLAVNDIQGLVPLETEGLAGATFGPIDGVVDPHWLTHAWVKLARQRSAQFRFDSPVGSIRRTGNTWTLSTDTEAVETPIVVNAAGAWAGAVAGLAGLTLPVEPMRNMIFLSDVLDPPQQYPMTIDTHSGFYLRSEGSKLLFGLTNQREARGFTAGMHWPWLENVLAAAVERFPWFRDIGVDHRGSWWGYYEMTPDHNPIIGRHPMAADSQGPIWIDAAGFSGHGIMHTPATGTLVAELAFANSASTIDISAFAHARFADSQAGHEEPDGETNAY